LAVLGRIAEVNVMRHPRRAASTAGALMVGMALVSAVSVLAASFQASVQEITRKVLTSDRVVMAVAGGVLPVGVADAVGSAAGVGRVDRMYGTEVQADGALYTVVGGDLAMLERTVHLDLVDGTWEGVEAGGVAVAAPVLRDRGWSLGERITLAGPAGEVTAPIAGVLPDAATVGPMAISLGLFDRLVADPDAAVTAMFLSAAEGYSVSDADQSVTAAVAPFLVVAVMDEAEFLDTQSAQIDQMVIIVYALLAMSLVIAALGIVNTLVLSVAERTREIGLMRAVGLGRGQLRAVVTLEAVLLALCGTVGGIAVGVGLAATLPAILRDQGLRALAIPWGQLVATLAIACVVGALAALWPAWRAARLPVLAAIAS
jgi:putative ABC transport system permease protein